MLPEVMRPYDLPEAIIRLPSVATLKSEWPDFSQRAKVAGEMAVQRVMVEM